MIENLGMAMGIFASPFITDYFFPRTGIFQRLTIYFALVFLVSLFFSIIRAYRYCKNKKRNGYGFESGVYKGIINGIIAIGLNYSIVMIPQLRGLFMLGMGDSLMVDSVRSGMGAIGVLFVHMVLIWPIWGSC